MARRPSDHMMDFMRRLASHEATKPADAAAYDKGLSTSPATGNTAKALVARGLCAWAYKQPGGWQCHVVLTDAGRAELQSPVAR